MDQDETSTNASLAGARASLIRHFSIEGLYGYRSLALDSEYAATVLIAKNGAGKTTLLGALDAFLKCQFTRFSGLKFSKIRCRIRGLDQDLVLTQLEVDELLRLPDGSEFISAAKIYELEPLALLEFMLDDYVGRTQHDLYETPLFYKLYSKVGYNISAARAVCDRLRVELASRLPSIEELRRNILKVLDGAEIVYLPTFRRIELSLPEKEDPRVGRRKLSILARLGLNKRGIYAGDIQFGLADISERLAKLNEQMLFQSNQGYREISANIINELITGEFDRENPSLDQRPSKEALKLFFERLREGRHQMAPFDDLQIPQIDQIYTGLNIPQSSNKFLTYFLGKLNTVMQKTKGVEEQVEEFIRNCNKYLSAEDQSASVKARARRDVQNSDDKLLKLDRRTLKVSVSSVRTKRNIPLDALSSGEKQMISLFARLYLYPGKKVVLIDEPELSLSLDWQRKILVDIVSAPSCEQVVAITHSPFVFDNELEEFATSLKLRLDPVEQAPEEEDDLNA